MYSRPMSYFTRFYFILVVHRIVTGILNVHFLALLVTSYGAAVQDFEFVGKDIDVCQVLNFETMCWNN